jgi:hypothetical protein
MQASQKWRYGGFNEKIAKRIPVLIKAPGSADRAICTRFDMANVARDRCKVNQGKT